MEAAPAQRLPRGAAALGPAVWDGSAPQAPGGRGDHGGDDRQELQGCSREPGEPPPGEQEEPRAAGGGDRVENAGSPQVADRVHSQQPEEFWQYNTFQYWRNPLPSLDLAALEDVSANSLTETLEDKNEGVEIDMES